MAADEHRGALFRVNAPHQHSRVTYAELFFDLVFVFAVTQISHTLLAHFTPLGVLQTTLLFLAVWWVWVYTSWITNWLDPEMTPVRILLFALMLGGLVLSTSIPQAFESRGLWFAIAYASMQVGKTVFLWIVDAAFATCGAHECDPDHGMAVDVGGVLDRRRLCGRTVAAAALGRGARDRILSAAARFWIPKYGASLGRRLGGRGRSHGGALRAVRHHRARRIHRRHRRDICRTDLDHRDGRRLRIELRRQPRDVVDLFPQGRGSAAPNRFRDPSEPGRLARLAYTYLHMPIVAGIIVAAVADELVLKHPGGHSDPKTVLSAIGGPLLFLLGTILFKHTIRGFLQLSHGAGIIALGILAWFAGELSPLVLSMLTTAIMVIVAVWELISLKSAVAGSGSGHSSA